MNYQYVRERTTDELSRMASGETAYDVEMAYFELKRTLRDYKNQLLIKLRYGKETNENDD